MTGDTRSYKKNSASSTFDTQKVGVTFSSDNDTPMIKKFVSPEKSTLNLICDLNPNPGDNKDEVSPKPSVSHNPVPVASSVLGDAATTTSATSSFGSNGSSIFVSTTQSRAVFGMPKTTSCTITSGSAAMSSGPSKNTISSTIQVNSEPKIFSSTSSNSPKSDISVKVLKPTKVEPNDQNDECKENRNVNYEDCVSTWELNLGSIMNSREKRIRDASGGEKALIRDTVKENVEMMAVHLKCFQCFRVFKDEQEVRDAVAQKHHFCATEGNLRSVLPRMQNECLDLNFYKNFSHLHLPLKWIMNLFIP